VARRFSRRSLRSLREILRDLGASIE